MYVAKFSRRGIMWRVALFEKTWSEEMQSHEVHAIKDKRFFLGSSGYRWINKEMARIMFEQHKLEIIDG